MTTKNGLLALLFLCFTMILPCNSFAQRGPGDFNGDGQLNVVDLNQLGSVGNFMLGIPVDSSNQEYDLNGDQVLDQQDIDEMLLLLAASNSSHAPIQRGDFNADLKIHASPSYNYPLYTDFQIWYASRGVSLGENFNQKWTKGDGNFDGIVDHLDLAFLLPYFYIDPGCPPIYDPPVEVEGEPSEYFGDSNNDYAVNAYDIDLVCGAIGTTQLLYDLDGSGTVTEDDLTFLRAIIGANLGGNESILEGDFNTDGYVDASDWLIWNSNKFNTDTSWSTGDANCDGLTNGQDYLLLIGNFMENIFD